MMVQIQFKEHLRIIGVVHVVVDGVDTSATAGVATGGATRGGRSLGRGVRDLVTGTVAATFKSVVEANPVTSFVSQSLYATH